MQDFFKLIGLPTSIAIVFTTIIIISETLERMSSPKAKADLSRYLHSTDFSAAALRLPGGARELFETIFSARQFSLKCIIRSIIFSAISILFLFALGFLTHFSNFKTALSGHPASIKFFGAWTILSLFIDYFNLYKTRLVLSLVTRYRVAIVWSVLIFVMDIFLAFAIFTIAINFILAVSWLLLLLGWGQVKPSEALQTLIEVRLSIPISRAYVI